MKKFPQNYNHSQGQDIEDRVEYNPDGSETEISPNGTRATVWTKSGTILRFLKGGEADDEYSGLPLMRAQELSRIPLLESPFHELFGFYADQNANDAHAHPTIVRVTASDGKLKDYILGNGFVMSANRSIPARDVFGSEGRPPDIAIGYNYMMPGFGRVGRVEQVSRLDLILNSTLAERPSRYKYTKLDKRWQDVINRLVSLYQHFGWNKERRI